MTSLASPLRWRSLTLPGQFMLAGAAVMVLATIFVEYWVSKRIEDAVVQNSAVSAALFMENFISPLSQELADTDTLSPPARQALAEVFDGTPLGERVVSFKIWSSDGALSGSGCVSMKKPATPTAAAARASTGANSRCPPEEPPSPPGCCTEWVASKTTG